MGGLIGLGVCAYGLTASTASSAAAPNAWPLPCGVRSLVLNDIGPRLEWPALERIATYVGKAGEFDSIADGAAALWRVASSFGPHTDDEWLALSRPMLRAVGAVSPAADTDKAGAAEAEALPAPATKYRVHYDPAIAAPFANASEAATLAGETMLWALYDRLTSVRALLVRGADSDLLSAATADEMAQRGPRARVVAFAGVGHAPTLVHADQSDHVVGFLLDGDGDDANKVASV
jgi:hypothetical protein